MWRHLQVNWRVLLVTGGFGANSVPRMKTVLVTGASSGMGRATAEKLLLQGYTVYVAARRIDKMRDLEELGAVAIAMDITKDDEVVAAVDRIAAENGGVDVLINNAGFATYGAMEDTALADARYQFEVNLFGLARLTQLVLPHMRQQGAGTTVNISSMGGKIYTPLVFAAWSKELLVHTRGASRQHESTRRFLVYGSIPTNGRSAGTMAHTCKVACGGGIPSQRMKSCASRDSWAVTGLAWSQR